MPHAVTAAFRGVFGQQDSGLGQQSDEHDKPRLHVDVVLHTEYLGEQETARQSERNGKHDRQRYEQALVKRAENDIDENDTDDEDNHDGRA